MNKHQAGEFVGYVYCVTEKSSGKKYVGATSVSVERRWKQHIDTARRDRGSFLHAEIRLRGEHSFLVETIGTADSKSAMFALERRRIAELGTMYPHGLNGSAGGEGLSTIDYSAPVREKMRRKTVDRWQDPEFRSRCIAASVAAMHSPRGRENISAALIKRWSDPAQRETLTRALKQSKQTPEFKALASANGKRIAANDNWVEKQSLTGKTLWREDPEYRARMTPIVESNFRSDAGKENRRRTMHDRYYSDPAFRDQMAERTRQLWLDPAYREKVAAARAAKRAAKKEKAAS